MNAVLSPGVEKLDDHVRTPENTPPTISPKLEAEIRHLAPIDMDDELGGRVFMAEEGTHNLRSFLSNDLMTIFTDAGYVFYEDKHQQPVFLTPDPERFWNAAMQNGTPIRFCSKLADDKRRTAADEYVETYISGFYPVSSDNLSAYTHDISSGHLTAILIGGKPLLDEFQHIAVDKDLDDVEVVKKSAHTLDQATPPLSFSVMKFISGDYGPHTFVAAVKSTARHFIRDGEEIDQTEQRFIEIIVDGLHRHGIKTEPSRLGPKLVA